MRRSRGLTFTLDRAGLRIARAMRQDGMASARGFVLVLAVMFLGKSLMLAELGEMAYAERVARLTHGTLPERLGGWLLQVDPISRQASASLVPILR